jgi:hypothetical protein
MSFVLCMVLTAEVATGWIFPKQDDHYMYLDMETVIAWEDIHWTRAPGSLSSAEGDYNLSAWVMFSDWSPWPRPGTEGHWVHRVNHTDANAATCTSLATGDSASRVFYFYNNATGPYFQKTVYPYYSSTLYKSYEGTDYFGVFLGAGLNVAGTGEDNFPHVVWHFCCSPNGLYQYTFGNRYYPLWDAIYIEVDWRETKSIVPLTIVDEKPKLDWLESPDTFEVSSYGDSGLLEGGAGYGEGLYDGRLDTFSSDDLRIKPGTLSGDISAAEFYTHWTGPGFAGAENHFVMRGHPANAFTTLMAFANAQAPVKAVYPFPNSFGSAVGGTLDSWRTMLRTSVLMWSYFWSARNAMRSLVGTDKWEWVEDKDQGEVDDDD